MSEINNIANQITNISPEFGNKPNITTDSDSGNFSNAIGKFLNAVSQDQMKAKEAVSDIVTGKSENLHEAMAKVEESKLSFELMLEVRNKLIDAYKEIQRM
ncbi:MAG: flagellar hook-basal body complex protein FliE [Candidatus Marinimicrobia bacterium]|nr:flagellar hook-basal body complex protein FliE [Candidatus Neomarinimicrobiota bacterium]|tara:strand:- start:340 stop:642 length:303 start_codon:yes stop_codon:yes gene_type:complete